MHRSRCGSYYTVFSLAPLVLVLLAIIGFLFRDDPAGAWSRVTEQMSYFLDKSAVQVVQDIAKTAAEPSKGAIATLIGVALALFGASGVFGQLQDALNTIWGVKAKPGQGIWGFLRARFVSFAMVGGLCFLLLFVPSIGLKHQPYVSGAAGGLAMPERSSSFRLRGRVLLFAMSLIPAGRQRRWRDVGSAREDGDPFGFGKWPLGFLFGVDRRVPPTGQRLADYVLLWLLFVQILLFGAGFTQFRQPGRPAAFQTRIRRAH